MSRTTTEAFGLISSNTQCIFARGARIEGTARFCEEPADLPRYVSDFAPSFVVFSERSRTQPLDGFVFGFSYPTAGSTVTELKITLSELLNSLSLYDDDARDRLQSDILDPLWRFKCNGTEYFILTIGPCYAENHARYGFSSQDTFILFQPFDAFVRHRPSTQDRMSQAVRHTIRQAYSQAGRPYDTAINQGEYEAYKIVKPPVLGAPPVVWWRK